MKKSRINSLQALLAIALVSTATTTQAALITSSAGLPPDGVYLGVGIHQTYGGAALEFLLTLPAHAPIAAQATTSPGGGGRPGTPSDEIENFGSTLNAQVELFINGVSQGVVPASGSGPVETIVFDKIGNVTGTFQTEMLSMDLSGTSAFGPFLVRESPTQQSTGETTITDIGGGQFQIDSFFDIHTELSIDGGATWLPSNVGAGRMTLVPEPSSIGLLALSMMVCFRRRR